MLKDLEVEDIKSTSHHEHPLVHHSVLPQHEFSMLIVAPKGSGKTNFLCNLILKHYKGYFHKILVCSPTVNNDEKWDVVQKKKGVLRQNKKLERILNNRDRSSKIKKVVFNGDKSLEEQLKEDEEPFDGIIPKEDFFTSIDEVPVRIAEQQKIIEDLHKRGFEKQSKFIADRLLVVLDDQAGMFKSGNTNNPMVNYVIKHRHASSSVIIVTQAYKAIPKTIRTNCNALILFDIPNLMELRVIYEENPDGMSEKEWMRVYRHATKEPYSFMYSNNKFKKGERVYKNFTTMLSIHTKNDDDDGDDLEEQEQPKKVKKLES